MNDLISRQAAIDALDEIEAEVADGYGYQYAKWREYFVEMPPAEREIKQQAINSSDCVDRRAAIDICTNAIDLWRGQLGEGALIAVRDKIKELPPAQPAPSQVAKDIARIVENGQDMRLIGQERIRGRWIPVGRALYKCDQCGVVSLKRKFCPNCGADMREVTE